MNVIETEALKYSKSFHSGGVPTINKITNEINEKISPIRLTRDKLSFLRVVQQQVNKQKAEHVCRQGGCSVDEKLAYVLFAINQEIEDIESYHTEKVYGEDEFTSSEKSILHNNINSAITKLLEQSGTLNQQVIDELESLKSQFDLGKRSWLQLAIGKIYTLTSEGLIDRIFVETIYQILIHAVIFSGNKIGDILITF